MAMTRVMEMAGTIWKYLNMAMAKWGWADDKGSPCSEEWQGQLDRDSLARSLTFVPLARWNNSLTHSHIKTVKSWLLDVLERNHSLSAEYKKTGGCAEKGCSTTNRCTWITLLSCHSSTPKKLVNKLNKVDKMDKVPLPTSLSKNIERKVDSPPFNLEQTQKIRFLWKVVWIWF